MPGTRMCASVSRARGVILLRQDLDLPYGPRLARVCEKLLRNSLELRPPQVFARIR
jgi:hypothetical protein